MPYGPATLIAAQLARVDWDRVYTLDTRRYAPAYLPATTVNRLSWSGFADAVPILHRGGVDGTDLEALIVAKSVTWSDRDVNVYVGSAAGSPLRSYLDLDEDRFVTVFGWHAALARELAVVLGRDVYVTHGFNPGDSSPDAHSVTARFHTHVHVPDVARRRAVVASALSHFDRLSLIEPFAVVVRDVLRRLLAERRPASRWRAVAGFGFVSLFTPLDELTTGDLRVLAGVLADLHATYVELVGVFTAGETEQATGHARYVPRLVGERQRRLAAFGATNAGWLSAESVAVLRYLAVRLVPAVPRDPPASTRIAAAGQAWIAKGLSGALNLVVPAGEAVLRFDVAPRVISSAVPAGGAAPAGTGNPSTSRNRQGAD